MCVLIFNKVFEVNFHAILEFGMCESLERPRVRRIISHVIMQAASSTVVFKVD